MMFGHCSHWNIFEGDDYVFAAFQLKNQNKTCLQPFCFHPRAMFNLFMQLTVVLETELGLYSHINIPIAKGPRA